jgi:hypothetical protein
MSSSVIEDKPRQNVELLNEEQAIEFFDKQARALLQISGAEFIERANKGEYKEACDNSKILKLLMMIPKSASRCEHK